MNLTVIRNDNKIRCTVDELQNGDIIIDGNLSAPEPYYLRPDLIELTLRNGNFANVLLDEPVSLTDVDGTVRKYPAATHTAGWKIEGGLHHCYYLQSVEEARQAAEQQMAYLESGLAALKEFVPRLNKTAENPVVLEQVQDAMVDTGLTKPELLRIGAKLPNDEVG